MWLVSYCVTECIGCANPRFYNTVCEDDPVAWFIDASARAMADWKCLTIIWTRKVDDAELADKLRQSMK